jgi:hypothetical protein
VGGGGLVSEIGVSEATLRVEAPPGHAAVYVGIGNSDGRLTQGEWGEFVHELRSISARYRSHKLGEWFSLPDRKYQNAEFGWIMHLAELPPLRVALAVAAANFRQDSVSLAIVARTEFVGSPVADHPTYQPVNPYIPPSAYTPPSLAPLPPTITEQGITVDPWPDVLR